MMRGDYPLEPEHRTYTLIGNKKYYRKSIDDMDDNSADENYERSMENERFESMMYPSEGFL